MVKLKLIYKSEIRLLSLEQPDNLYSELLAKVREIAGVTSWTLQFRDAENRNVMIESSSALCNYIGRNSKSSTRTRIEKIEVLTSGNGVCSCNVLRTMFPRLVFCDRSSETCGMTKTRRTPVCLLLVSL